MMKYIKKSLLIQISRDDHYRGTTLVVDTFVYLSLLLTIILTVFSFIKTFCPYYEKDAPGL